MLNKLGFMQNKTAMSASITKASEIMGTSRSASWSQYKTHEMLVEGYEGNAWVFSCIRKKMQAAGSVPLILQEKGDDGYETVGADHPIKSLMANPCPGFSGSQLIKTIIGQLEIQGQFFGKVVRGGRGGKVPLEIWPLAIGSTSVLEKNNRLVGYKYDRDGYSDTLGVDEVLHIKYTHPDTKFKGMAPMIAGGKAIDIDNEASSWQKISMQNRGIPDGVFTMEGDVGVDEWESAKDQVREQYQGKSNARAPWVVANATFHQMSQSMADLDFMQGRAMTREEICATHDVPPPLVGILDKANYSNIETARKIFWRDTMLPILSDIASQITAYFMPSMTVRTDMRLTFDTTNVSALQDSMAEKMTLAKDLFGMGVPLSVINRRLELDLELESVSGTNVGYLPAGLMPVAQAATDSEDDGDSVLSLTDDEFDRIMQIASRVASGDLEYDSGISLAALAIPSLTEEQAREIIRQPGESE